MIYLAHEARLHAHQVPPRTAGRPGRWRPRMDVKQLVVAYLGGDRPCEVVQLHVREVRIDIYRDW